MIGFNNTTLMMIGTNIAIMRKKVIVDFLAMV